MTLIPFNELLIWLDSESINYTCNEMMQLIIVHQDNDLHIISDNGLFDLDEIQNRLEESSRIILKVKEA